MLPVMVWFVGLWGVVCGAVVCAAMVYWALVSRAMVCGCMVPRVVVVVCVHRGLGVTTTVALGMF